ncbi:hypothetical protein AX14_010963, partial [Amanita brunnescens Koide BX004]
VDGYSNGSYSIPLMAQPPHGKKHKLSGLSEEGATNQEGEQDSFEGRVFDILALFKSRLEEPQALSFSGMDSRN